MIPNIIHFVFGLSSDFGQKYFCLVHHLAIKSAYFVNKPDKIYLHYTYEPGGYWWEKSKKYVELSRIEPLDTISGKKLYRVAHKSDIVRLQKLIETGGIYLDMDTLCLKPFTPLLGYPHVMGLEGTMGLCNAIMLSEKNAVFANAMLQTYRNFRSKGVDEHWGENSVLLPFQLG
jgi:mannosyltransferase OCH1-like enzyme